ncbi:MAG TPA: hypothetical protein VI078_04820 [bacterium]
MKKSMCIGMCTIALLGSIGVGTAFSAAGDLIGAREVLQRLTRAAAIPVEAKAGADADEAAVLARDLREFRDVRAKFPAEEAAARWLALYDRFWMLPPAALMKATEYAAMQVARDDTPTVQSLMSSVPPPAAWPALKSLVSARPDGGRGTSGKLLRLTVSYLTRDQAGLTESLAELKTAAALSKGNAGYLDNLLRNSPLLAAGAAAAEGKEDIAGRFERYLGSLESERKEGRLTVQVPDLVELAGETRAEALIRKALAIPGLALAVPSGGATLDLAKRIVRERAADLLEPQWQLVTGIDDVELYEALERRFPAKSPAEVATPEPFVEGERAGYRYRGDDSSRRRAAANHVLGLIARKRAREAAEAAAAIEADAFDASEFKSAWQSFDKMRFAADTLEFCRIVLTARPELPLWSRCGLIAAASGEQVDLVGLIAGAAARPDLDLVSRLGINERQVELLLAMDRVDEAVRLLGETLRLDAGREAPQARLAVARAKARLAPRLCRLGRLLGRPELSREAAAGYPAILAELGQQMGGSPFGGDELDGSPAGEMVDALEEAGLYAEAEGAIVATIESVLASAGAAEFPGGRATLLAAGLLSEHLARLAELYDKADRSGDALALVEESAWWGAADLTGLADRFQSLLPIVGRALHSAGRDAEAVAVLQGHLLGHPGDDPAYRALLETSGPSIAPWLDALYARDRFEERPLIWKANLWLREGKLAEAEATVRQALKVDPTDGEAKQGDRVRGYAVLAEVLKAEGKAEDAAFFERVVASVRVAERGDALTKAGLIRRSLASYEEAATSFADAYCVQWRLAERLSAMGNVAEARKHYQIAFERMPEQFGQVASFCFGCEGVFNHPESRSVAEQVLGGLAQSEPRKPQVQYLLGQLREAQGRKAEAYRHYRAAADLDPEYLDAWEKAYSLSAAVFLPQKEIDDIGLRMIRLDPLRRHVSLGEQAIWDPAGLWAVYEDAGKLNLPLVEHLLPLKASAASLDELKKSFGGEAMIFGGDSGSYRSQRMIPDPGEAVAADPFLQGVVQFVVRSAVAAD